MRGLTARVRANDWSDLLRAWRAFIADLEAHFAFEDRIILPAFRMRGPAARDLARRLEQEHAAARQLADSVRVQIERQRSDPAILDILDELMAEHAALERESIEIA